MRKELFQGLLFVCAVASVAAAQDEASEGAIDEALFLEEGEQAEPPMVVTAERLAVPRNESGNAISVVSGAHIALKDAVLVEPSLEETPGLWIAGSGPLGAGPRSLFMRGAETDHTLVLIDGHKVNQVGGFFDWDSVTADALDRIEVWRGAGSAVYGSDALAGVVNLVQGAPAAGDWARLRVQAGDQRFTRSQLMLSSKTRDVEYHAGLSRVDLTDPRLHPNYDYENTTFAAGARIRAGDRAQLNLTMRQWDDVAGVPTDWAGNLNNPNGTAVEDAQLLGMEANYDLTEQWQAVLRYSRFEEDERFLDPDDPFLTNGLRAQSFERNMVDTEARWTRETADWKSLLTLGFSYEFEALRPIDGPGSERNNRSLFVQERFSYDERTHVTIGARGESNQYYDTDWSGRLAVNHQLSEQPAWVHASVGRGIKAPQLIETLDSLFTDGNPDLDPEAGLSVDAGVRVGVKSWRTELDVTGFFHGYQDLIVYEPSGFTPDGIPDYRNGGEAEAYGVEVEARARPTPRLMLRAAVTWMETEATDDLDNPSVSFSEGEPLVRRPTWLGSLSANVKPIDRLALQAALYYVGDRDDLDFNQFPTARVENEAYTRLDLSLRARLIDRLFLIGRMQNVLDEEYEEIFGFRAQGQFWYGGLEYRHRF